MLALLVSVSVPPPPASKLIPLSFPLELHYLICEGLPINLGPKKSTKVVSARVTGSLEHLL